MAHNGVLNIVYLMIIYVLIIILSVYSAMAQSGYNGNTIAVGSSLTATNNTNASTAWFSPSGDFAFGFQQIHGNDNLFLLSIWYDKIPDKTIVWFPNEATDPVPLGSRVELSAGRGLVLTNPQGEEIWNSELPPAAAAVGHGVLNDTGNFALVSNESLGVLWSTFDHPSDTLLPTQIMERGGALFPRTKETNFSNGRFSFLFQMDGNLVLYTRNDASNSRYVYHATGTNDNSNASNSGTQLIFDETGLMYVLRGNGQRVTILPRIQLRAADYYLRATFNFDGVFSIYYHPRVFTGNPGWTTRGWLPSNVCLVVGGNQGRGVCGDNNVCKLQVAASGRPICECPRGYSLLDPNDTYGSCKPDFNLSCNNGVPSSSEESLYDLEELLGTDWPSFSDDKVELISRDSCRNSCLTACSCAAAIYQGTTCVLKKLPLLNGRNAPQVSGTAFLKFRKGDDLPDSRTLPLAPERQKGRGFVVVGSVLLGSSMFFNLVLMAAVCSGYILIHRRKNKKLPPDSNAVETNLRCFSYEELAEATNGFNEELGRGGFGIVYKGVIGTSSQNVVAVKKLDKVVENGDKGFKTEVDAIAKTHHKNLVRLLGLCDEGEHRLLVYEYMSKGTLASFLFADKKPSWKQRTQIALGIARGLSYLHEECSIQIIHCDIKPQNILLDEHYDARISDFGLAKILMMNHSRTHTAIRGTKGYLAPEWFRNTPVTVKVDVYSFGVLLLEIISCRRSVVNLENGDPEKAILTDWAWDCFQGGRLDSFVDDDLEVLSDWKTLEMFVMVGIWCIQEDPSLRPTMRKVSLMLEGVIQVTKPPSPSPSSLSS